MTALEKMRAFVASYPGHNILDKFQIDYTDAVPGCGGIFPNGLVEIARTTDIIGNKEVQNQYNFALYYRFEKAPDDDTPAEINADWLMDFQEWIQQQSCKGLAPVFGDDANREQITAQNGMMFDADIEGTALYTVQLSVTFIKRYEVTNIWQM